MEQYPVFAVGQHTVTIRNKHGQRLVGVLHETGTNETVILCHGFMCSKNQPIIMNIASALEKEGISVFRFDFAGNGDSEGSFQFAGYYREVEDIRAVTEYFRRANRKISAILGHSRGGNVVLLYASKYHDIDTVVNVSGRYYLDRGIEWCLGKDFMEKIKTDGFFYFKNKEKITEESLLKRLNINMHDACLSIDRSCRVLTIHGSEDIVVKLEDALEFAKVIPNHTLHVIAKANHGYTKHQAELAKTIVSYMKDFLQHAMV